MALLVEWMASFSSIGRFSIIISCRNSSQVDVEEWESLSWTRCTISGRRVRSVRFASKDARHYSKSLRFVDVFPGLDGGEGINHDIVV